MSWPLIWMFVGAPVTVALMIAGTFTIIHLDERSGKKRKR